MQAKISLYIIIIIVAGLVAGVFYFRYFRPESQPETLLKPPLVHPTSRTSPTVPDLVGPRVLGAVRPATLPSKAQILGQEILVDNNGAFLTADYDYLNDQELAAYFGKISENFDIIEVKVWSWGTMTYFNPAPVQLVIDRAHEAGVDVAISTWSYPDADLVESQYPQYHAYKLNQAGFTETVKFPVQNYAASDDYVRVPIDRANPEARAWFAGRYQEALSQLNGVDYIFFNEDKLQGWRNWSTTGWPLSGHYYDSPTYTLEDLDRFRDYLIDHYGSSYGNVKFPVLEDVAVNQTNQDLLTLKRNPEDDLWLKWYEWRYQVFAEWLESMSAAAYEANQNNDRFKGAILMSWQRNVADLNTGDIGMDPRYFGISWQTIGKSAPHLDRFVLEYGEDGVDQNDLRFNEENTITAQTLTNSLNKKFGAFAELYVYSRDFNPAPNFVRDELKMGLANGADMIVAYDTNTFSPQIPAPGSNRYHYNEEILAAWQAVIDFQVEPDKSFIKGPGNTIYYMENGQKRAFPSLGCFLSWYQGEKVKTLSGFDLGLHPDGPLMLLNNGSLVKSDQDNTIYLIENNKKRPFNSWFAFASRYRADRIKLVNQSDLDRLPLGVVIKNYPDGYFLRGTSPAIFYLGQGLKHFVPTATIFHAWDPDGKSARVPDSMLGEYPTGEPIGFRDGNLIKTDKDGTIYLIKDGKRKPIASWVIFLRLGFKPQDIITATEYEASFNPLGDIIK